MSDKETRMMNSTQQSEVNGGTPLADPTGSAFEHGMVTWECNECQQIGATYCCRISVDIGHGDNHALASLACPQRCPWFDWCESYWYRVSKPNIPICVKSGADSRGKEGGK